MTHRVVELFRKLDTDLRELVSETPEARAIAAFDGIAHGLVIPAASGTPGDGTGLAGYGDFRTALQGRLDQTLEVGALHLADFALKEVERLAATHAPAAPAEPAPAVAEAETAEEAAEEEAPTVPEAPAPAEAAVVPAAVEAVVAPAPAPHGPTNGGAPRDESFHAAGIDADAARRVADLEAELARARARLSRPAA